MNCDDNETARNGVGDRISIGALFGPADFATYADQRMLVLCDIEGAERQLLDIELAPVNGAPGQRRGW